MLHGEKVEGFSSVEKMHTSGKRHIGISLAWKRGSSTEREVF